MRRKILGISGGLGAAFVAACGNFGTDTSTSPADDSVMGGDASSDAGTIGPSASCDATVEPRDPSSCLTDAYGVFVNGKRGDDANDGSRDAPVRTIGRALAVVGTRSRVYVCSSSYTENVSLTKPVSIYGGFDCETWAYTGDRAVISPKTTGYALDIQRVEPEIVVADIEAVSRPGIEGSVSSIAVRAAWSRVHFLRDRFSAGAGFRGADGEAGTAPSLVSVTSGQLDYNGNDWKEDPNDTSYLPPGITPPAKVCTCSTGDTSTGGAGGDRGSVGGDGLPTYAPGSNSGKGGKGYNDACMGGNPESGYAGSNGPDADASAARPSRIGSVENGEWVPAAGLEGPAGKPGQGGGGGGGSDSAKGSGAGGACGGCGGLGGKGGEGGGASVALLSVESQIRLERSELSSEDAGAGGARGVGGQGAAGGVSGQPGPAFNYPCTTSPGGMGGAGGNGGRGGDGSGGAGGVSAAIFYSGELPTADDATTLTHGKAGAAGKGSTVSSTNNAGVPGVEGAAVEVPSTP